MNYKKILSLLIVFSNVIYGQEIESNLKKLETLDWDIMYCGRTIIEEKEPCTLSIAGVRPCVIGHTPEANSALQANWVSIGLEMTMLPFPIRKYDLELDAFVKRFTATMARRFDQTRVYFTDESQLDISFEGMPTLDT